MTDNTPNNNLGPVWLVVLPSLVTAVNQIADASADVKRLADNVGLSWLLPHLASAAMWLTLAGGLVWLWRRAVGRERPWALWLQHKLPRMPWEHQR